MDKQTILQWCSDLRRDAEFKRNEMLEYPIDRQEQPILSQYRDQLERTFDQLSNQLENVETLVKAF